MLRVSTLVAGAAVAFALTAPAHGAFHVTTPSGNIDCRSDSANEVWCTVEKGRWGKARPASGCPNDWFPRDVRIERGRVVQGSCRGDIGPLCLPPSAHESNPCRVLAYGRSARLKTLRCTSTRLGVTCRLRNGAGVGFRIAREGYRRF